MHFSKKFSSRAALNVPTRGCRMKKERRERARSRAKNVSSRVLSKRWACDRLSLSSRRA